MRLLVLGGTGPTGIALITEALSHSHLVVVYARSPGKLPESITSNPSVTIVEGQLTDVDQLSVAMQGVDAVLSALGPAVKSGPFYPNDTPLAHAYTFVIEAMKKQHITRLIALGTPSMKDEHDQFSLAFTALVSGIAIFAHSAYKDVVAFGETIRSHEDLEWTIARVPLLNDHDTREVVVGYVGDGKTGTTLSRAGFAAFVVQELEKKEWCQKSPLVSSA